jgi:hypothetical protein
MGGHGPEKLVREPSLATRAVQDVPPPGGYKDVSLLMYESFLFCLFICCNLRGVVSGSRQ